MDNLIYCKVLLFGDLFLKSWKMLRLNSNLNPIIVLVQQKLDLKRASKHVSLNEIKVFIVSVYVDYMCCHLALVMSFAADFFASVSRRQRYNWGSEQLCRQKKDQSYYSSLSVPQPGTRGRLRLFILILVSSIFTRIPQVRRGERSRLRKSFYRWEAAHVWVRLSWLTEREQKSSTKESYYSH